MGLSPYRNGDAKFREAWRPLTRNKAKAPGRMLGGAHPRKPCSPGHSLPGTMCTLSHTRTHKEAPLIGTTIGRVVQRPASLTPEDRGETAASKSASLLWCLTQCLNYHRGVTRALPSIRDDLAHDMNSLACPYCTTEVRGQSSTLCRIVGLETTGKGIPLHA